MLIASIIGQLLVQCHLLITALEHNETVHEQTNKGRVVTPQYSVSDSAAGLKGVHRQAAFEGVRISCVKARRQHKRPVRLLTSISFMT